MRNVNGGDHISNGEQFEALFNYATIGIVVTDLQGSIVNFNKRAETLFGYSKEDVLGQTVELLIPPEIHTQHKNHRRDYYQHPSPRDMGHGRDLFARRKDGSVFPVEVSLSNYSIDDELFVIAFVIDITVRKQHEAVVLHQREELESITRQVTQLNRDLEKKVQDRTKMLRETLSALETSKEHLSEALRNEKELGELKSRFVTMASHEFKTPLSTILSSAFLLEKYNNADAADKRRKHTERIKNAVEDMKNILDDFLSLGKLEEGLIRADMATVSAEACLNEIENAMGEMETHLKKAQRIDFRHEGDGEVALDKHLLKNIVINLLSNAIKFSPENTTIEVNCSTYNANFTLSVRDRGIGISEEDKEHLFERFFRAKNAVNIQGTGLGLHIIAKYLELMQGSIEIESTLNAGSVFTIYIPKKIAAMQANKKILIIEDNSDVRENIAEILELSNYQVCTAENGKEGVEMAMQQKPDLIVCDIMMPELDGYGVLHLLGKHIETYGIPFIFLTAKSEKSDLRKGMELGADDYITKPFDGIELLKAIEIRLQKADAVKKYFAESSASAENLNDIITDAGKMGKLQLTSEEREVYDYKKKQLLYSEGQRPKAVYYIKKGKVKIYKTNEDGKELITNIFTAGDFLGYTYILEELNYKENAEILEDAEIMKIPKDDFISLITNDTQIAKQFIKIITHNVIEKEESLLNLAYSSLRRKVAFQLLNILEKFKRDENSRNQLRISRENLAQVAGIATESLIRTLSDFKTEKLIDIQSGTIIVLNENKLRNLPY